MVSIRITQSATKYMDLDLLMVRFVQFCFATKNYFQDLFLHIFTESANNYRAELFSAHEEDNI